VGKVPAGASESGYKLAAAATLPVNTEEGRMGVFDIFSKKKGESASPKKSEREVAKLQKLVGNKMSQNYDRQQAIEELGRMGTPEAALALLKRFDWTLDPSITDQEEKEAAAQGVIATGEVALEPIRKYCARAESLTWPLRILQQIVTEEHIVDELLGVLDEFDTEYTRNAEPKEQLIATLEEYPCDDVRIAVEPFLQDASEPVRFRAATTTFAMGDEQSVPALLEALEEEESLRVKNRIAQGLAERGWKIPSELQESCRDALPDDFKLDGSVVRRVG
jgi:HEAT repeat protein